MKVDWLSFTYNVPFGEDEVLFNLFLEEFPQFKEYLNQMEIVTVHATPYEHTLAFDSFFRISYNDDYSAEFRRLQGVHVVVNGSGLAVFCKILGLSEKDGVVSCYDICKTLADHHCKISRIDVCFDDFEKKYFPDELMHLYMDGYIKTKIKQWSYVASCSKDHGTFYLGKRVAGRMIRIYDKAYQSKGKIDAIRWEIEYRKASAAAFQKAIIEREIIGFGDLIRSIMEILVEPEHGCANVDRAEIDEEWVKFWKDHEFCEEFDGIKLEKPETNYEKLTDWINRFIAPSLGVLASVMDRDQFKDFLLRCRFSMKKRQLNIIKNYMLINSGKLVNFDQEYNPEDIVLEDFYSSF